MIFLFDYKLTFSNKKYIYNIEYKGLLWIGLDHWSIWKYNSKDKPIKWFKLEQVSYTYYDTKI